MPRFPDTVWSESRDYGGMFDGEVGVCKRGDKFYAYVADGWGGGAGKLHLTLEAAKSDIERLWNRYM